ncbi:MAG: TolC family protein [Myxococcota bacterium]
MSRLHAHPVSVALLAAIAASSPRDGSGMSLDEAVERALTRHPTVQAARHAEDGAEARTDQARTAWLPRVEVEGAYRYSRPVPDLSFETDIQLPGQPGPLTIDREIGTAHNASVQATAGWRALDFGARSARIRAAEAMERAAGAEGRERALEVAWAVRAAYAGVLLFEDVEEVTRRALETTRAGLEEARAGREAGLAADVTVAGAESRVATLEARLEEAHRRREKAATTLRLLLGLPEETALGLSDDLADLGEEVRSEPDGAHPRREGLEAAQAAVEAREESVRRSALPALDLFATGGYRHPQTFVETDAGPFWAAGLSLTWEVFDGDLRRRQRAELDARRAELDDLDEAAREDLVRRRREARGDLDIARAARRSADKRVESARVYLEAARGALDAGTGTALEVRRAEEAVDAARLEVVRARFDAALARADWLRAAGHARAPGTAADHGEEEPP